MQVTYFFANILGENRLATLGFPDTDILDILYSVLGSARLKPYSLGDTATEYTEDRNKYAMFNKLCVYIKTQKICISL